jgi:hypothetical protein
MIIKSWPTLPVDEQAPQVIRNDTHLQLEGAHMLLPPIVHSRNEGIALMKARWELEKRTRA